MKTLWIALIVIAILSLASLGWAKDCWQDVRNGERFEMRDVGYGSSGACIHVHKKKAHIRCKVSYFGGRAKLLVTEIFFKPNNQFIVKIDGSNEEFAFAGEGTNENAMIALEYYGPWNPTRPFYLICYW